jgi:hypothetical protein
MEKIPIAKERAGRGRESIELLRNFSSRIIESIQANEFDKL